MADDDSSYVPAKLLHDLTDPGVDLKTFLRWIDREKIPTQRPTTRRLLVHAGIFIAKRAQSEPGLPRGKQGRADLKKEALSLLKKIRGIASKLLSGTKLDDALQILNRLEDDIRTA